MTFSLEGITDFLPCNKPMAGATGEEHRIEGYRKLRLQYVDDRGTEEMVTLDRVAYVHALQHNLFPLMTAPKSGFSFVTTPTGVSIFDGKLHLKSTVDVLVAHASRHFPVPVNPLGPVATLTPGHNPGTVIDINLLHCAFGHAHEDALGKTAEQLADSGVELNLVGKLHPCTGCALGKSLRRPIPKRTHHRAGERLARVFIDLSGKRTKSLRVRST
ncbi:unnamed protein product [Discosporangium mesarthrocarpum]